MSEKTETIEDIIRGMRKLAGVIRKKERVEGYEIVNAWSGYEHFANRILAAHNRECEQLNTEIEAMSKFNDALNAQMKELAAECEKLRFDNLHLKSVQRQAGEVVIEQTNKVEAKDAEIVKLNQKVYEYEKLFALSPIGVIYQLGIHDEEGEIRNGCCILFTEVAEAAKMPRVGHGDRFYVVPYKESEVAKDGD